MAVSTGTALIAGASALSGGLGFMGSKKSAEAAEEATEGSLAESARQFDITRADTQVSRDIGDAAKLQLAEMLNLNPYLQRGLDDDVAAAENQQSVSVKVKEALGFEDLFTTNLLKSGPLGLGGLAGTGLPLLQKFKEGKERTVEMGGQLTGPAERDYRLSETGYKDPLQDFDVTDDPGYKFRLGETEKAVERIGAKGGYRTSPRLKMEMADRISDLASQEYGAAYGRAKTREGDRVERLFRLAGFGGAATNVAASAGASTAAQTGQALRYGAGLTSQAEQYGTESLNQAVQGGVQNYMTLQKYNQLKLPSPSSGAA